MMEVEEGDQKQASKPAVPRFSSFKPREATASSPSLREVREPRPRSSEKANLHHAEAGQPRHRRQRHEKYGQNEATRESRPETHVSRELRTHESRPDFRRIDGDEKGTFFQDRKCDENNIKYGTPSRYNVPIYREAGLHRLLGLPRHFKASPELEHGRRLITDGNLGSYERHPTRSLLRSRFSKESGLSRIVPTGLDSAEVDAQKNYLPLSLHTGRKRRKLNGFDSSANSLPDNLYEIQSHHDAERVTKGRDTQSVSTSSDSEIHPSPTVAIMDCARERNIHLSRLVDESPADVNAWLALIHHQDHMLAETADGPNKSLTSAEKYALGDIKLSMYEKALSKTKGHPSRDQLISSMMIEAAKVWDTKKLAKEWMSILEDNPKSLGLWMEYLNFRQSSFITFDYDSCRTLFKDCLNMFKMTEIPFDAECIRIYVFLRMTAFMHEAGFSEYAHALWQAILEYCFFEPSGHKTNNELSSFGEFWDSELPRLGEDKARGWGLTLLMEAEPRKDPTTAITTGRRLLKTWTEHERQSMTTSVLPARTIDEADDDDPYRMILFSDIQPFMFRPSSLEARQVLIETFLKFCGLPPLRFDRSSKAFTLGDPFLTNSFLDRCHPNLDSWLTSPEQNDPYHFPISAFVTDITSLFVDKHWFNPWEDIQSALSNKARRQWVQRSFRQLLAVLSDDELLAEYVIAFESQLDVKEARKYAKSLLKQRPSIRLYNSFALLEYSAGNIDAAERVWSTAMSMRSSFSEKSHRDIILIWRSWLWALLSRQDFARALRLCLAIPDEKVDLSCLSEQGAIYLEKHPTAKLRVHQYLSSLLNQNLSINQPDMSIHYLDVLSVFTYLTSKRTLPPVLTHYQTASSHPTIASTTTTFCLLHQSRSRILHLHATTSPSGFRPRDITNPLAESIRLFPDNTIFLLLYHFHNRRSLLTDRIRDVLPVLTSSSPANGNNEPERPKQRAITPFPSISTTNPTSSSIIPPIFNIYTEINRPTFAGSTSHSIRAAFEKAVSDDNDNGNDPSPSPAPSTSPVTHSPKIWKLYILWELHVARTQQRQQEETSVRRSGKFKSGSGKEGMMDKVVQTLDRAIRACPWVKELYMLAFEIPEIRDAMREREGELKALYEAMGDKGLRVHVEMDEDSL